MNGKIIGLKRSKEFSVDVDAVLERAGHKTKLIFLCSPNNPTGNITPVGDIDRLVKETNAVVGVDEAYFEFAGKSAAELIEKYDNLVVIRTFSKAFSMAGVRVGYLMASKTAVGELNKVRPPNSLTVISLALAESALGDLPSMKKNVAMIVRERERCFFELSKMDRVEPYPSQANFILFRLNGVDGDMVHLRLMEKGFVLRNFADAPATKNCLRVTMSTPDVNGAFLEALRASIAS
jgi:histidinol-phosphate aminotransferase